MKAALAALLLLTAGQATACEVALALTIDVSGSIDPDEYALQMNGLAKALEDPTVADALVAAKANLLVMQWSDERTFRRRELRKERARPTPRLAQFLDSNW